MLVGILVAVCLLAAVCAAPTHNLPTFLGLEARQLVVTTARDHHGVRPQQRSTSSPGVDAIWASTKTRSGQRQRSVRPTFVDQPVSGPNRVRLRSRRGAIVNGFTSWDYEPFDKLGAFRSKRGE